MSTLGTTTILGDLIVTGELKASNSSGGSSDNCITTEGNKTILGNVDGFHEALGIKNSNTGTNAMSLLRFYNDAALSAGLFRNSSTRTADGGPNSFNVYNDNGAINLRSNAEININGCPLIFNGGQGNFREGIRLNSGGSGWSTLTMGGTLTTGSDVNTWSIHRNPSNQWGVAVGTSDFVTHGLSLHPDGTIRWKNRYLSQMTAANGYYGLVRPSDGNNTDWIRTTVNGFIPYQSGGASSLGTASWPFNNVYANAYYLRGNNLESLIPIQIGDSGDIKNRLPKSGFFEHSTATIAEGYPTNAPHGWMHLINCQHSNAANNYALQIAAPFHEQRFFARSTNGSGSTAWSELVVQNTTLAGQIQTLGRSTSWLEGSRGNQCFINQTTYSGWYPLIRAKSTNGAWTIGNYASDIFYINYTSDTTMNAGTNACDRQFQFFPNGDFKTTRVFNAIWNDYAEYFEKQDPEDQDFEPGDVIVSIDNKYVKSTSAYQETVIGVYSDSFGHIVGGTGDLDIDNKECIPVGLAGRVSVKVIGKVKNGQLLTSSDIAGVAMYAKDYKPGTIIGKAVEDKNTEEIGKVKMFIMNI